MRIKKDSQAPPIKGAHLIECRACGCIHEGSMSDLHEAASVGDLEKLEEALARGMDPNEPDPEWGDRTPLHIAAANGYRCSLVQLNYAQWMS